MGVVSADFLWLVAVVAIAHRLVPWAGLRVAVLTAANLAFLASFAREPVALLPLAGFLLQGWICTVWVRARPSRTRLAIAIAWLVFLFIVLKQYTFIQPLFVPSHPFVVVGLSYVLFRVLHLMVDCASGERVEQLGPLRFFNYTTMFLGFVTGPIQRYEDYLREETRTDRSPLDGALLFEAMQRVTKGLVKLVLLAPLALHLHGGALRSLMGGLGVLGAVPPAVQLAGATLAYLVFLYWNFSGSMDVIIGAGKLMGFALPENFDRPFTAPNLIDFWSHWHITLSEWFRTYLFNPIVAFLTRWRTDVKLAPFYGVLGFFVTFFVMGAWHGTTGIIILYGILLGAGVSLNKLHQVMLRKWLGKRRHQALTGNPLYQRAANGFTIGFVATALACMWLEWRDLLRLVDVVGPGALFGALMVATVVTMAIRGAVDALGWLATRSRLDRFAAWSWTRQAVVALEVLALLVSAALGKSDAPPFVYATF